MEQEGVDEQYLLASGEEQAVDVAVQDMRPQEAYEVLEEVVIDF